MATIEEEMKRRALEMQGMQDKSFDFGAVASKLAGTPIPATHAYGLSPENVAREAQLGQQAQAMKQRQVGQNLEMAMQRDSQLAQKIQMAHQNVMAEKKLDLDKTLANLEAKRTNASIGLMGAQAGAIAKQNELMNVQIEKASKDLNVVKALDSTMISVPTLGPDGNIKSVEMSAYAAKLAGFDVDGPVRAKIAGDARERAKIDPFLGSGFEPLDAKTMMGPYMANYRLALKQRMAKLNTGRRGAPPPPDAIAKIQQEAKKDALESVKGLLSEKGRARVLELDPTILDELGSKSEASSAAEDQSANITKSLIDALRNAQ